MLYVCTMKITTVVSAENTILPWKDSPQKNNKKNHTTTNKPPTDSPNDPRHDRIKKTAELLPHRGANRDRATVQKYLNAARLFLHKKLKLSTHQQISTGRDFVISQFKGTTSLIYNQIWISTNILTSLSITVYHVEITKHKTISM